MRHNSCKTFKYFDVMNKGKVTFDQFYRSMDKAGVVMERDELYTIFKSFD